MAEYNPSKIIKDGNTYNFRDTTKIPLAGSNEISGSLIPSTDGTVDLGSSTAQWNNAYIKSLAINGVATGDILTHNASEFALVSDLSTVATSGSYNDLSNKPTIPIVNDATLTIQQNGTTVDSFSANSSSDKTVNIQCVDLNNNQTVGGIKTFSNAPVVGSINLDGKTIDTDANDNMTFNSHIVDTIEEQGNGYIRYSNGLQICWGNGAVSFNNSTQGDSTFTYPKAFISPPAINITSQGGNPDFIFEVTVSSYASACNIIARLNSVQTAERYFFYTAIGKWK